ncbi:MAG: chromate transporter [Acetobacteraceae bacterium]
MTAALSSVAAVFGQLSLLAFGGGNSILPEMQRQVVAVHPWMTARDFAALYALAQAAPGPNMLVSTLIGLRVAGIAGAVTATAALCLPASALTFVCAHVWNRMRDRPWRTIVQAGVVPVTVGLVMASAALLVRTTAHDWRGAAVVVVAAGLFLGTRLNPLWVLGAAAALGATGLLS